MIKNIKPAILIILLTLSLQKVNGQVSANMPDYLSQKFLDYTSAVPREEIYVHSDREDYISGEELWFNVYLIDRQSLKPSVGSKIAYVELLNPESRPIVQKRILLDKGFGPGQIVLPDTLSTGTYTIRAYTGWMKNFLPDNCFIKDIHIYNAFSNKTFKEKVGFRSNIGGGDVSVSTLFPTANSGIAIKADNLKPDSLEIDIETDENFRASNNLVYLFIQTHGNINLVNPERLNEKTTKIFIPKKQLSAGINQLTLFNSKGKPVAERFIYTPDKEDEVSTIHSVDSAGLRAKIDLDLDFGPRLTTEPDSTNFSISVTPETNFHSTMDIGDYLVFGSEFGIRPDHVLRYKRIKDIPPEAMDSLLLTVRSNWINWNTILEDKLPEFEYKIENEDHILSGKLTAGVQKEADSAKYVILSVPGKTAVFQYAKTDVRGDFTFKIHIDEKVNDLVIQPDAPSKYASIRIESPFSDRFQKYEKAIDTTSNPIPGYILAWSVNHQVRKIYGTSAVGEPVACVISVPRLRRFYGKPDTELEMKDYIKLPVMQEVFFELLPGVGLKSKKSGYELSMANPDNFNKVFDTPPALFVDGVLVKDPSVIVGFDPEMIEKIDVIRVKYFVGDYLFTGIVNIITKAGDFSITPLPDYAVRMQYRVIDPVYSFVSPDYSSLQMKKSRIPDFRNTLYWNPSVKPDKVGKARVEFWTSDFVSDYEVNIQGITKEGKRFTIKKIIKVKR
jgi:hypothetical protein